MSRVLVTGATGFIGSHLVEELVKRRYAVRCLVRETSGRKWLHGLNVDFVVGDVTDPSSLESAVAGVDIVFHAAGISKSLHEEEMYLTNATGTTNLIKAVVKVRPGLQRFVYLSSIAAAGPSSRVKLLVESDPPNPVTSYGASKLAGEDALLAFAPRVPTTIIRAPVVFGPRDPSFLPLFRWVRGGIKPILGFRQRYVSMVYVDDLVRGLLMAAESRKAKGQTYYIVSRPRVTYDDFMTEIAASLHKRAIPLRVPATLVYPIVLLADGMARMRGRLIEIDKEKIRRMSPRFWICDGSKAREELGFEPRVSLHAGIHRMTEWYRKMGWL